MDDLLLCQNHIHGLIKIKNNHGKKCRVVACNDLSNNNEIFGQKSHILNKRMLQCNIPTGYFSIISPKPKSLSTIIRSYKSICTKTIRIIEPSFAWQSRFYDHIIRNETSLFNIQEYIKDNPPRWDLEKQENICKEFINITK